MQGGGGDQSGFSNPPSSELMEGKREKKEGKRSGERLKKNGNNVTYFRNFGFFSLITLGLLCIDA